MLNGFDFEDASIDGDVLCLFLAELSQKTLVCLDDMTKFHAFPIPQKIASFNLLLNRLSNFVISFELKRRTGLDLMHFFLC